jgi:phage baseplate assembly protein W
VSNIYGTDLWVGFNAAGQLDIDATCRETSGIQVLAQSLVMRQLTPLGSVIGAPNECIDLRTMISKSMTLVQIQQVASTVKGQLLRDPRVQLVTVTSSFSLASSVLTLQENVLSGLGPFTLTLAVSALTAAALLNGVPLGSAQ